MQSRMKVEYVLLSRDTKYQEPTINFDWSLGGTLDCDKRKISESHGSLGPGWKVYESLGAPVTAAELRVRLEYIGAE